MVCESCSYLADSGAQVCTVGQEMVRAVGLNSSMIAKTRLRVRGVNKSDLNVMGDGGG